MQIKQAHIINFGKLSNKDYTFSAGINQFIENNGHGKTTLMAFIKAMLYGFDSKNKEERSRYAPWNMGVFGGSLIVENKGKEYRIERTFGKTPAKDLLRVYNNKTLELLDVPDVGIEFLGLDEQSFLYTTYINEDMLKGTANSVLIAKLTQLNKQGQQDLTNYDNAVKNLDDAKRKIKNKQGGRIGALNVEITQIDRQIESAVQAQFTYENLNTEISHLTENVEQYNTQLASLDEQIEKANKNQGAEKARKTYLALLEKKQEFSQQLSQKKLVFPLGTPTDIEMQSIQEKIIEYKQTKKRLEDLASECASEEEATLFEQKYNQSQSIIQNKSDNVKKVVTNKKPHILGCIIGAMAAICGICLSMLINLILGIVLCGCGFVYALISIIFLTKKAPKPIDTTLTSINTLWNEQFTTLAEFYDFVATKKSNFASVKKALEQRKTEQNNLDNLQSDIITFFAKFNITYTDYDSSMRDLQFKVQEIKTLEASIAQLTEQIEMFDTSIIKEDNILNLPTLKANKEDLFARITQTNKQIAEYKSKQEYLITQAEKYQELCDKKQKLQDELDFLNDRYIKITYALDFLNKAKQNLGDKYILPTQEKLNELAELFDKTKQYTPIKIKDDLSLMYEENGSLHSEESLSSGLRHAINLLYRFALAQTIFDNEQFCLFLDDTFATLDEKNLLLLRQFVNKLAENNQIIYFTCSKERDIIK